MTKQRMTSVSPAALRRMKDRTKADAPEGPSLGSDFWDNARIAYADTPKKQLTIRLDADMVEWFKRQGKGYQTRMNAVLRFYYEAQRHRRRDGKSVEDRS